MKKKNFKDLPSEDTPINSANLMGMQNDIEESVVAVSPTQPITKEKVWFQKGKNLFDKNNVTNGKRLFTDGLLINDEKFVASDFIEVVGSNTYSVNYPVSAYTRICYYDNKRQIIKFNEGLSTFQVPSNCKYVRIGVEKTFLNKAQLEQGKPTPYEPYIPKKILTKNSNGVFEEFYNEENYNFKSYEISSLPQHSAGTNTYLLQKKSGICILSVDLIWLNSIASGSWIKIGTIPLDIAPMQPIGAVGIMLDGSNGNPCGYGKILIRETGVIEFKTQTNIQRLVGISFNITW